MVKTGASAAPETEEAMPKKGKLTQLMAVLGSILAWLPLLAPLFFALGSLFRGGSFLFDYLMPAELFPVALLGGGLLLWAAIRARAYRGWIGWSLLASILLLVGSQALAAATGIASGRTPMSSPWFYAVVAGLILFTLSLVITAVSGIRLARDLFKKD